MAFFAAKGKNKPSALARRRLRQQKDPEHGQEGVGWYRRFKNDYENYVPPPPPMDDPAYAASVRARAAKERQDDKDENDGGWGAAWNVNDNLRPQTDDQKRYAAAAEGGAIAEWDGTQQNVDPWAFTKEEPPPRTDTDTWDVVADEPEVVETLQPATEASLDAEELRETERRRSQEKHREMSGRNRISVNSFATPFDQRYGGRPDMMMGTIKCDFIQLKLPKSPSRSPMR